MTLKRKRFIEAYLGEANGNATQAAILAGYSDKRADAEGSRLLGNVEVRQAINKKLVKADLSTAARLEKVRVIADAEPTDIKALDVLKANELILKVNGALKDKQSDSRITVNIGFITANGPSHEPLQVMASLPRVIDVAQE